MSQESRYFLRMHNRVAMTAACVVSTGLFLATPWALAESSSGTGTPQSAIAARAGAVTLGQFAYISPVECPSGANPKGPTTMAQYVEAGAPSYTTPFAGVITSYSVRASGTGLVRLVVFGPSATAGHRRIVAFSAQNAVAANTSVNTFKTRVPVTAGLSIGLNNSAGAMICWGAGAAGDQVARANVDPTASNDYVGTSLELGKRVNISAVLEPDVDGDQYGDISQDLCPQSKLAQVACPAPDTTVTKKPKRRSASRKAKITFSSTIAGSTFTCRVDGKAATPCTSPYKKKVKVGKHTVVITATSAAGIVDPSPAKVKFKVTKPKR
jgi:hypothetical protein